MSSSSASASAADPQRSQSTPGPSSPPPGSRTSSPARSMRSRMGTVMRRASTGIPFAKAVMSRSQSKSSLRVDSSVANQGESSMPSPVPESPAREAAAEEDALPPVATTAKSPLSESTVAPVGLSVEANPAPQPAPALDPAVVTSSPESVDQSLAPEAPVSNSQPQPAAVRAASTSETSAAPVIAAAATDIRSAPSSPPPAAFSPVAIMPGMPGLPPVAPAPLLAPAVEKKGADYITAVDEHILAPKWSSSNIGDRNVVQGLSVPQIVKTASQASTEPAPAQATDVEATGWETQITISPKQSTSSLVEASVRQRDSSVGPRSGRASTKASKSSMASSYGQVIINTGGKQVSVAMSPDQDIKRGRSPGPSVRISVEDPFADPPGAVPTSVSKKTMLSPIYSINTPIPENATADQTYNTPISFPLPPQSEVIASQSVRGKASAYSLDERIIMSNQAEIQRDTDETLPLLRGRSASASNGKGNVQTDPFFRTPIPFPTGPLSSEPATVYSVEKFGWKEHVLPDGSVYYSHAMLRAVTDADLRSPKKLRAVREYLERKLPEEVAFPPQGWELWLRDSATSKQDVRPVRNWVNHSARILSFDPPPTMSGDSLPDQITDDDRLDMEYRYWNFLEAHPAHAPISSERRSEAIDTLTWSYSDSLLPSSSRSVPPPFAPQECQELMGLLKSMDSISGDSAIVQTRIVAGVMLRVAQWRQFYYRPHKLLPQDVNRGLPRPRRRTACGRMLLDVLVSCICLGIPYLFLVRSRNQRLDEESGLRSAGPMLMIVACACLVSAIILSASVTFISLPGLDDISRLAGLLGILLSASSMISSVIALFRYKTDVERSVVHVGGEGLMLLTRGSIVMSLPLVFLAWGIAAFITGITFYSFKGATMSSRVAIKYPFEDYTHWTVVATMGGLVSLLAMSALLARR